MIILDIFQKNGVPLANSTRLLELSGGGALPGACGAEGRVLKRARAAFWCLLLPCCWMPCASLTPRDSDFCSQVSCHSWGLLGFRAWGLSRAVQLAGWIRRRQLRRRRRRPSRRLQRRHQQGSSRRWRLQRDKNNRARSRGPPLQQQQPLQLSERCRHLPLRDDAEKNKQGARALLTPSRRHHRAAVHLFNSSFFFPGLLSRRLRLLAIAHRTSSHRIGTPTTDGCGGRYSRHTLDTDTRTGGGRTRNPKKTQSSSPPAFTALRAQSTKRATPCATEEHSCLVKHGLTCQAAVVGGEQAHCSSSCER